jgi:uroporphyrinogen decarboxylase
MKDEWGVKWVQRGDFLWAENRPLAKIEEISQLDDCEWPDITIDRHLSEVRKRAREIEEEGWAVLAFPSGSYYGLLDTMSTIRGYEQAYIDLYKNPELADAILDRILNITIELYRQLLDTCGEHIQLVVTADDWGSQTGLRLPPPVFRRFFYHRYKKLHDFIHRRTQAKIIMHSCGSIEPLLNDLIETGVDVIDPIQPLAKGMESRALKAKYGDRIAFHGGIDSQKILPFGSLEDIRMEVLAKMTALAPRGGYIASTSQCILPGVSPEKLVTLYDSMYRYASYGTT